MVAEGPVDTTTDRAFASCVAVDLEVPDACRCCDDKLAAAHDERIDPEEHEDLIEGDVASLLIPLHLGEELVIGSRRRRSNRKNENCAHEPYTEPNHGDEVGKHGQEEDPQV